MAVNMFLGIGENLYEDQATLKDLREAEANVENIAECAVRYLQFDRSNVYVMTNRANVASMTPTYANIESFARGKIAEVNDGALVIDTLLVYVAVHGFLNELRNKRYLCLRATQTSNLDGTSLSYDLFWEWLLQFKARNTIVIGDVCQEPTRTAGAERSDRVKSNEDEYDAMRKCSLRAPRTIERGQTRPNQIRVDACGPGEFTYDGVYGKYLDESIKQLATQYSRVSIGQISNLAATKVANSKYGERCHPRYTIFEGCGDVSFETGVVEPTRITLDTTSSLSSPARFQKDRWIDLEPGAKRVLMIEDLPWTFIYCPPTGPNGFWMGSPALDPELCDNERLHKVVITKPAWLMDTVVTQGQYHAHARPNGQCSFCAIGDNACKVSGMDTSNFPIERVNWREVQNFVKVLNMKKGKFGIPDEWRISLPSEALHEYACRDFGENEEPYDAGALTDCGWFAGNSGGRMHEVRTKKPNKYGFYDFHGLVWELCQDSWRDRLTETVADPCYDEGGAFRVRRGGGWGNDSRACRASCRRLIPDSFRGNDIGFRLALVLE